MRAVWLEEGRVSVRDVAEPAPPPGEALVRVLAAGICNTDLELIGGYYPFRGVLGHEFVGVVEEGPDRLVGQRVVGEINATCGDCPLCRAGLPRHCERRSVLGIVDRDGAFAERLVLPAANLHPVPDRLSDERAVFVEPLAAALAPQGELSLDAGTRVLVVGTGKLGQLVARALALTRCALTALGRRPRTLELLRRAGIDTTTAERLETGRYDVAVECTGNAAGFDIARRALRPRGTLVMKSTYRGELTLDAASIVVDELRLVGSRCGDFPPALELLGGGRVEVDDLIDGRYGLEEATEALAHAARPGALKILLEIG